LTILPPTRFSPEEAFDPRWALLYLLFPAVIFLAGFIQPGVAIAVGGSIVMAWFILSWRSFQAPGLSALIPAGVASALLIVFAGFPSGPYAWDWIKHWAIVNELTLNNWPVQLELDGAPYYLRYYSGAYLTPALFSKSLPVLSTTLTLGLWFFAGYFLVLRSLEPAGQSRNRLVIGVLLLFCMGGADFYAAHVNRAINGLSSIPWLGMHYDSWPAATNAALPLEYSSLVTALLWVPHQSIATFIVAAMLLYQRHSFSFGSAVLAFGLLSIWSPYGMIGLLPLMLTVAWFKKAEFMNWKTSFPALAGASFALIVADYLSTNLPNSGACFSCLPNHPIHLPGIFVFLIVELLPFVLILRKRMFLDVYCLASIFTLLILPFAPGQTGDFVMRGSMGPLFVLSIRSVQTFLDWRGSKFDKVLYVLAIVLTLPAVVSEVIYQRQAGIAYSTLPAGDPLNKEWLKTFANRSDYSAQEFLEICGQNYLGQYFSTQRPNFTKTISH
jgi:hypothetical protein